MMIQVNITTILLVFEQFSKIIAQSMPISPCPKIFQYKFDGNEWFGVISVRNFEAQSVHIRVLLSLQGKLTTNYLGEIELLTRENFTSHILVYKIRFPKNNFLPKLVLILTNNEVICFGSADYSIFMTQIQLEHTRKLTFKPKKKSAQSTQHENSGATVGKKKPSKQGFRSKPLPHIKFKKYASGLWRIQYIFPTVVYVCLYISAGNRKGNACFNK